MSRRGRLMTILLLLLLLAGVCGLVLGCEALLTAMRAAQAATAAVLLLALVAALPGNIDPATTMRDAFRRLPAICRVPACSPSFVLLC